MAKLCWLAGDSQINAIAARMPAVEDWTVVNKGWNGERSGAGDGVASGGLERIGGELDGLLKADFPDLTVLLWGTNDLVSLIIHNVANQASPDETAADWPLESHTYDWSPFQIAARIEAIAQKAERFAKGHAVIGLPLWNQKIHQSMFPDDQNRDLAVWLSCKYMRLRDLLEELPFPTIDYGLWEPEWSVDGFHAKTIILDEVQVPQTVKLIESQ